MKIITYRLIALLLLLGWEGSQSILQAQTPKQSFADSGGALAGTVVDDQTGETLIGVNVVIRGTVKGAATNAGGRYRITGLNPDTYTVKASFLSYAPKTVKNVEVEAGETTNLDIRLKPQSEHLGEVTVTARSVEDNETALLSRRQKAIGISNSISAESISKSGAGDAAEAVKKVVGASVVEGKYVHVRGLGDRYSGTQLNGANLPSADPDRKSFQMDLFPGSLIKNITAVKTFTPDKPGDFTGGLVNVETRDFPERFTFEFSAEQAYNTQNSFGRILQGNSSSTDFLGFDNGARKMPDPVRDYLDNPEKEFPRRNGTMEGAEELDRLSKSFNRQMAPREVKIGLDRGFSASIGNLVSPGGNDLGYTASLTYSRSYSGYDQGTYARWAGSRRADSLSSRIKMRDRKGEETVDIGGLLNLSYRWSSNHKLSATYLRSHSGTHVGRSLRGTSTKDLSSRALFQSRTLHYIERGLDSYQLEGTHSLQDLANATVDWRASYAKNTREEPDLRYVWNVRSYLPAFGDSVYSMPMNNVSAPPSRYFRDLDERSINTGMDVSIPFPTHTATRGKVKFGGSYTNVDRIFREDRIEYRLPESGAVNLDDVEGDINEFFSHVGILDTGGGPTYGLTIDNATTRRNNYDASRELYALYGMVELPIADRLKLTGGIRMEDADIETISRDPSVAEGHLENTDFLPSVNFTYSMTENMNARASFTRTLARPTFRELAPYVTFQFVGDYLFSGNANLKRTLIQNYDVRWEWFPNPGEVVAVSGFYKRFQNPLERVIRVDIGNNASSIQNVDRGRVYGAEFELRSPLDFLGGLFRHVLVSTNLTLVHSRVDVPRLEMVEILNLDTQTMSEEEIGRTIRKAPEDAKHRPLSGQSPYTFNFDISYENPDAELSADLTYNLFGDRLAEVMRGATPNSFERAYGTLNFVGSKAITEHFTLDIAMENLLNPKTRKTQRFKGTHYINQSFRKGRTFKIGITYNL